MAQQGNQAYEQKYCCSICLDLLKDPVTIPCGHNYCMSCITNHWNEDDQKIYHSCPQCRQEFRPRPAVVKNTLLAELVEDLKKTGLRAAPADHCYAGPGDLACDVCTGRKLKASKSCLVCVASYCETHLQPHYESPAFKTHKLVEPSANLQETICSRHDEVRKIFCRTDQECICLVCSMDEHKGHDTVSAATARAEKQQELDKSLQNLQQRIQDRDKDLKLLQQEVEVINRSADKAVEDSEDTFTQLIRLTEQIRSEVKQLIRSQQETEVSRVKELQEKLEQEMAELKRSHAELMKLSHTEDHTLFLHNYPSVSTLPEPTDSPRPNVDRLWYFKDVRAAVRAAKEKMREILTEPITRAVLLQYSCQITLDPNTAHNRLVLSEGDRKVTRDTKNKPYPHHPDRFIHISQVLSKDGLTGRCYWEVEKSSSSSVSVAVAYRSIGRSGDLKACIFGYNEKSWALYWDSSYTFRHDKCSTKISGPESSRVGVYLDHSAGTLSFYSVSETMTLLHRVQTRFTEPLYAGVYLYGSDGVTAEFCKLK